MKILITGAKGQLGKKLIDKLKADHDLILTDSEEMDITKPEMVTDVLNKEKPDFIIHAAAYTAVDKAEAEGRDLCYKVNALGSENLAKAAEAIHTTLLYISTDYVFPGTPSTSLSFESEPEGSSLRVEDRAGATKPLNEDDPTDPVNFYGQTKLDGENFVRSICKKYYIIRTAWLYGELPEGHPGSNFVETMLKLAHDKGEVDVVSDQIGSPTYTGDLVNLISEIIDQSSGLRTVDFGLPFGTYHFSGEGEASWYDFAKEIFDQTKTKVNLLPITTDKFPRPAKRPAYSYLSKEKLKSFGFAIRPWQDALTEYLEHR